ncbi:uncharacterized protein N7443_010925 [Penicillium atrosanguineum]|uniref:uncharacterized protein n=1 Tax=Penicillium atrosanguineum TaxID=1132637 RepID=UPI0023A734EE|nr:uncharacterized protein N7443_010925 [Penicillium atrosanguineum]KAJ5290672.1 hypothetical protein N7443_010925 [Penicillium atrosanguineum]
MMIRHEVRHILFLLSVGYPDGAILSVFDAIYNSKNFGFVLPRHEQGAGHMAHGYTQATGEPGIIVVTSGPGVTNLVTSIMDALADGTLINVFCGQVTTSAIGSKCAGNVLALTKWNTTVHNTSESPRKIDEAFEIALSGQPGPVLVELPIDVTAGIFRRPPRAICARFPLELSPANLIMSQFRQDKFMHSIDEGAKLVNTATRPVLYVGQGILATPNCPRLPKQLAEKIQYPLQGLGAFDETDIKALHILGLHRSSHAIVAIQYAGLVIALGARFDGRMTGSIPKLARGQTSRRLSKEYKRGSASDRTSSAIVQRILSSFYCKSRRPNDLGGWFRYKSRKNNIHARRLNRSGRDDMIIPQHVIERRARS